VLVLVLVVIVILIVIVIPATREDKSRANWGRHRRFSAANTTPHDVV
jgi:competence protein ComGC